MRPFLTLHHPKVFEKYMTFHLPQNSSPHGENLFVYFFLLESFSLGTLVLESSFLRLGTPGRTPSLKPDPSTSYKYKSPVNSLTKPLWWVEPPTNPPPT